MLSQEVEEQLADYLVDRIEETNEYILKKIGEAIKKISTLKPSEAYKIAQILKYGGSYEAIAKELAKVSGKNVQDIYKIFEEVAKQNKQFAKEFYDYRGIDFLPYNEDSVLQQQVNSIARITAEEYINISRTRGIGFLFKDINGKKYFKDIEASYYEIIDRGIISIGQGKETFQEEMRKIINEIGNSGVVKYESGYSRRLDTAVRMNLLDGIRQVSNETSKMFGEQYGADGVEISVHTNPAPDHADIQGRQFRNEQYTILEEGGTAVDVKGIEYDGSEKRHISEYNCYHKIFPIIVGVSEPQYTDEQLKKIQKDNLKGFEFDGKHYTMYEGTQLQRKLETEIRRQKETQILAKASGKDFEPIVIESQQKIDKLTSKYNGLCKVSGLKPRKQRMSVSGYQRTKIEPIESTITYETDEAINSAVLLDESDKWWNGLEREKQKSIYRYTSGLNNDVNMYLSDPKAKINMPEDIVQEHIKNIDESIDKFNLNENIITYRKANLKDILNVDVGDMSINELKEKFENNVILNESYISTSIFKGQAEKFKGNTIVEFKVPKGTKGAFIGEHSMYRDEREFLMARNTKYIINKIKKDENGSIYIDATIINEKE